MPILKSLLDNNRRWAEKIVERDPDFFNKLARQQSPNYLWIGCSDSRVPANQIVDLMPGDLFVHRNVANVVVHTDLNCLSVIQFAVDVLGVEEVIVCGHYGCGGVLSALKNEKQGLITNWLRHVQDVAHKHQAALSALTSDPKRADRLCELNVIEQVLNVCQTTIVQAAWERGKKLTVHGWIYGIANGLIRDLGMSVNSPSVLNEVYQKAISS